MTTKMNPEVKQMWVNALLSGDYTQAQGKLRTSHGFCCLGVLTDLYAKETNQDWILESSDIENIAPGDYYTFEQTDDFLPESVKQWAGLPSVCPEIMVENDDWCEECGGDEYVPVELSELNDNGTYFHEIAKLIEDQF